MHRGLVAKLGGILEWMLASSIPHVDGACIWLPYFDIALYILMRLLIFKIKEIFIYLFKKCVKLGLRS